MYGFYEPIYFNNLKLGVQRGYESSDYSAIPTSSQQLEEPASKKDMAEYMEIKLEGFSNDCKLYIKMKKSELNQQRMYRKKMLVDYWQRIVFCDHKLESCN